jgi:hypothetical protein
VDNSVPLKLRIPGQLTRIVLGFASALSHTSETNVIAVIVRRWHHSHWPALFKDAPLVEPGLSTRRAAI